MGCFILSLANISGCGSQQKSAPNPSDIGSVSAQRSSLTASQAAGAYVATKLSAPDCSYNFISDADGDAIPLNPSLISDGSTREIRDEGVVNVALNFPFYYYGVKKTSFWVSVNGMLSFGAQPSFASANTDVYGSGARANTVAPWWDDMILEKGVGFILKKQVGTSPNRTLTIEWYRLHHFDATQPDNQHGVPHSLQVVLYERDSSIEFRYDQSITFTEQFDSATVGLTDDAPDSSGSVSLRTEACTPNCKEGNSATVPQGWGAMVGAELADGLNIKYFSCLRHTPAPHRYQVNNYAITGGYASHSGGTAVPFSPIILGLGTNPITVNFPTGFSFPFFGRSYSSVNVSSNGLVSFGDSFINSSTTHTTLPSPTRSTSNFIAGWWGRMISPSVGNVTTYSPQPTEFVIQYENLRSYDSTKSFPVIGAGTATHQLQIHLFSDTGIIEVHYGTLSNPDNTVLDQTTVGIQDTMAIMSTTEGPLGDYFSGLSCSPTEASPTASCKETDWNTSLTNHKLVYTPYAPTWSDVAPYFTSSGGPGHCANCHSDIDTTSVSTALSSFMSGFISPPGACGYTLGTNSYCMVVAQSDNRPNPLSMMAQQDRDSPISWLNLAPIGSSLGNMDPNKNLQEPLMPFDTFSAAGTYSCAVGNGTVTRNTRNDVAKREILSWFSSIEPSTTFLPTTVTPVVGCYRSF